MPTCASIQRVTEEIILKMAQAPTGKPLQKLGNGRRGGLNSAANGRLMREGPFENVFIQQRPRRRGAIGAACMFIMWRWASAKFTMEHATGRGLSESQMIGRSKKRFQYEAFETTISCLTRPGYAAGK